MYMYICLCVSMQMLIKTRKLKLRHVQIKIGPSRFEKTLSIPKLPVSAEIFRWCTIWNNKHKSINWILSILLFYIMPKQNFGPTFLETKMSNTIKKKRGQFKIAVIFPLKRKLLEQKHQGTSEHWWSGVLEKLNLKKTERRHLSPH